MLEKCGKYIVIYSAPEKDARSEVKYVQEKFNESRLLLRDVKIRLNPLCEWTFTSRDINFALLTAPLVSPLLLRTEGWH